MGHGFEFTLNLFPIPMKHMKKIKIGELHSSKTTHTMTTEMTDTLTKTMNTEVTDEMDVDVNMSTQNMTNTMTPKLITNTNSNYR